MLEPEELLAAQVPLAVMPRGVEHETEVEGYGAGLGPLAVMPRGVEHKAARTFTLSASESPPRRDAERR